MSNDWCLIHGFDDLLRASDGATGVTHIWTNLDRSHGLLSRHHALPHICSGQVGILAAIPLDFECFTRLQCVPVRVSNHGQAFCAFAVTVSDFHHVDYARHALGFGSVEALHFAANRRCHLNRGVHHARHHSVDAILGCARGFRRGINPRRVLTQQPVLRALLQVLCGIERRHGGGWRHEACNLPVTHLSARGAVDHHAGFGGEAVERDVPAIGCGLHQHAARLCTSHPERRPVAEGGNTGDHVLRFEDRMRVGRSNRRLFHHHSAPVSIEFFGNDEGQVGHDALPHLGRRGLDGDGAIGGDRHVGVEAALALGGGVI